MHRFGSHGFYILDEPEAALSLSRQMMALTRIHQLVLMACQFVIATHSPIIMAYPDAQILQFTADAISAIDYSETEHFFITREFLNHRDRMLKALLSDDEEP